MKKVFKFFAAALAIVAAASCAKENAEQDNIIENGALGTLPEITLNASFADTETKLTLKDNLPHWESSDRICVFHYNPSNTNDYNFSPYDGAYFSVDSFNEDFAVFKGSPKYVSYGTSGLYGAIYPGESILRSNGSSQNANTKFSKYIFASNTLASQTAVLGDFSKANFSNSSNVTSNISIALQSDKDEMLSFRNINAYLKFTVGATGVRTIEISTSSVTNYSLSGMDAQADLGGTIYYYPHNKSDVRMGLTGDTPITFTNGSEDFQKGGLYYVAIPSVRMSGLTVTLKDAFGNVLHKITKSSEFTATPNTVYNLGEIKVPNKYQLGKQLTKTTELSGGVMYIVLSNSDKSKCWTNSNNALTLSSPGSEYGDQHLFMFYPASATGPSGEKYASDKGGRWLSVLTNKIVTESLQFTADTPAQGLLWYMGNQWDGETGYDFDFYKNNSGSTLYHSDNNLDWGTTSNSNRKWLVYEAKQIQ